MNPVLEVYNIKTRKMSKVACVCKKKMYNCLVLIMIVAIIHLPRYMCGVKTICMLKADSVIDNHFFYAHRFVGSYPDKIKT